MMTNTITYFNNYSDEELMILVQDRNTIALKTLYEKYNIIVFNFILRYTGHNDLAQDILQETFTRTWYAAHTFKAEKGKYKTWLFTIALNTTRNEMRKKRYSYNYVEMSNLNESELLSESHDNSPELITDNSEKAIIVQQAINELKPYLKEIIILKHYQQLKFREIAVITNTPEGTLKARFHKAISELKEKLISVEL